MNQILNGRYRIDGKVGDGGMAVVYRGWDTVLNRVVAVKVLREQYAVNTQFLRRFQREAQSAAGLAHPNIVSVYDVGRDGETWYIVMELIDGTDLAALIRQRAPYSVAATTDIMAQVMSALDYAHERGIVHRDVKPHNILIDSRGTAKVVDFGIAKGVNDITMTDAGTALGTAGYISPEQATGAPITAMSDIYSAGVVAYEMLTGRLPFTGDTAVSVAMQHVRNAPPPPTRFNPQIPPSVEMVVLQAMAKASDRRFASGAEFVAALRSAVTNPPSATAPQPVSVAGSAGAGVATAVLSPETRALPMEAPAPRIAPPGNGSRSFAPPPTPPPRRSQPSGPGVGVWILGVLLLAGLIAAAYFGYQLINVTSANNNVLATQTVSASILGTSMAKTAAAPTATTAATAATPIPSDLIVVPNFSKLPQSQLQDAAMKTGVMVGMQYMAFSDDVPAGSVIEQTPKPGERAKKGSLVNFVISSGPAQTDLTKLVDASGKPFDPKGKQPDEVVQVLRNRGLVPVTAPETSDVPVGQVSRIAPADGAQAMGNVVANGSAVTVFISTGKPTPTAVPPTAAPTVTATAAPTMAPTATAVKATATPEPTRATASGMLVLPSVFGLQVDQAEQALKTVGFTNVSAKTGTNDSGGTGKGTVFAAVNGSNGMPLTPGQPISRDTPIVLRYQEP